MYFARIVDDDGQVVFSGKFDRVEFVRKNTPHPLYPEHSLREDRNTSKIVDAGEYVVLLVKNTDEEEECPAVKEVDRWGYGFGGI